MVNIFFIILLVTYIMWAYRAWLYIIYKQGKGTERTFLIFILKQTFFRVIGIGAYPPFLILNNDNPKYKKNIITINTITIIIYILMFSILILSFIVY